MDGEEEFEGEDRMRQVAREEIASLLGATLEDPDSPALRAWAAKLLPKFGDEESVLPGPEE